MDIPDGPIFITRLAQWVRNNDKALSSSTPRRPGFDPVARSTTLDSRPSTAPLISSKASNSFVSSFTFGFRERPTSNRLYLTPNQIYYLLSRFEELGVIVGPMDVRMENIELDSTPSNYVSFLTHTKRPKRRTADQDSLHSVSSVRSVVSSISSLWSNLGMSTSAEQKEEKRLQQERIDLKYLYTAMTLVPSVKFALDHRISRIIGFEEFPFDTAVPLWNFKSLGVLEIVDLDFRAFYGWDRLAEQLRSLTLKRAGVDDLTDLLTHIVLDDIDRRRRRSAKSSASPVMAFASSSPAKRKAELARVNSAYSYAVAPESPSLDMQRQASETSAEESATHIRLDSTSPPPTASGRRGSAFLPTSKHPGKARRSSSSSSSNVKHTPRTSSLSLLQFSGLPPTKWRFLKHLSLPENGLTSVPPLTLLPLAHTLQSLDLTGNLFTELPESLSMLVSLRALNLTGCMIESLNSLARNPLPAITVLNLSNNRLRSLAGIDRLYSLERIDVRGNQLTDPSELARLTGMPDLRDVFVNKNPFTKTHPNFRIHIFNLFRRTPGYVADITIDQHGPSYSERKQLAERAPERVNVPVIKPPHEDEVPRAIEDGAKVSSSAPNPRETSGYHIEPRNQVIMTSSDPSTPLRVKSKRKAHRRRVVDMSQSESPRSLHAYGASPDASKSTVYQSPITTLRKVIAAEEDDTPYQPGTYQGDSRTATPTSPTPVTPTQEERPDLGLRLSSEQYRSKIEALKLEHGSHWLNALNNESHHFYQARSSSSVGVSRAVT